MNQFSLTFPESASARGLYLIVIILNALLSFRLPSSLQGLCLTCIVYALLLTGKPLTKVLALLFSVLRLTLAFSFPVQIPLWTMLVTYSLSFLLCWILYKISVSADNQQLLTLFNVKLLASPTLFLTGLEATKAYFIWEHAHDRYLDGYHVEINNHICCRCDPHERSLELPNLRPNSTYRIRIWAFSKTRGKAPSLFISFHTLKENSDNNTPTAIMKTEIPTESDIQHLETELRGIKEARENIRLETLSLQSEDSSTHPLTPKINEKKQLMEELDVKLKRIQLEVGELKEKKSYADKANVMLDNKLSSRKGLIKKLQADIYSKVAVIDSKTRVKNNIPKEITFMEQKYEGEMNRLTNDITFEKNLIFQLTNHVIVLNAESEKLKTALEAKNDDLKRVTEQLNHALKPISVLGLSYKDDMHTYLKLNKKLEELTELKDELNKKLGGLNNRKLELLHSLAQLHRAKTTPTVSRVPTNELSPQPLSPTPSNFLGDAKSSILFDEPALLGEERVKLDKLEIVKEVKEEVNGENVNVGDDSRNFFWRARSDSEKLHSRPRSGDITGWHKLRPTTPQPPGFSGFKPSPHKPLKHSPSSSLSAQPGFMGETKWMAPGDLSFDSNKVEDKASTSWLFDATPTRSLFASTPPLLAPFPTSSTNSPVWSNTTQPPNLKYANWRTIPPGYESSTSSPTTSALYSSSFIANSPSPIPSPFSQPSPLVTPIPHSTSINDLPPSESLEQVDDSQVNSLSEVLEDDDDVLKELQQAMSNFSKD